MTAVGHGTMCVWRRLQRLFASVPLGEVVLPVGAGPLWLALRRGEDVYCEVLEVLRAQPHLESPAVRQLARDLAFGLARSARRHDSDVQAQFDAQQRRADLGAVQHRVGELLDRLIEDDQKRPVMTVEQLANIAGDSLRQLADSELARPRLRFH